MPRQAPYSERRLKKAVASARPIAIATIYRSNNAWLPKTSANDARPQVHSTSISDDQSSQIDGFLNFLYALLGMSVFIAVIGVAITLWLAVWERRREIGLLRAVGMTKRQVRSSVLWESLITGVVGVVMGVVLGTVLGWIIVKAFEDDGLGVFQLPIGTIIVSAVVLFVLSGLAALIPGRKGSNSDILEAIATT